MHRSVKRHPVFVWLFYQTDVGWVPRRDGRQGWPRPPEFRSDGGEMDDAGNASYVQFGFRECCVLGPVAFLVLLI